MAKPVDIEERGYDHELENSVRERGLYGHGQDDPVRERDYDQEQEDHIIGEGNEPDLKSKSEE